MQYSRYVRNAKLDAIEAEIGPSPVLKIWEGAMPLRPKDQDRGRSLVTMNLPRDWMESAVDGIKDKAGVWSTDRAGATGTAEFFRLYDNSGICQIQGSVGLGEDVDMQVSTIAVALGQPVVVERFTIADLNG